MGWMPSGVVSVAEDINAFAKHPMPGITKIHLHYKLRSYSCSGAINWLFCFTRNMMIASDTNYWLKFRHW